MNNQEAIFLDGIDNDITKEELDLICLKKALFYSNFDLDLLMFLYEKAYGMIRLNFAFNRILGSEDTVKTPQDIENLIRTTTKSIEIRKPTLFLFDNCNVNLFSLIIWYLYLVNLAKGKDFILINENGQEFKVYPYIDWNILNLENKNIKLNNLFTFDLELAIKKYFEIITSIFKEKEDFYNLFNQRFAKLKDEKTFVLNKKFLISVSTTFPSYYNFPEIYEIIGGKIDDIGRKYYPKEIDNEYYPVFNKPLENDLNLIYEEGVKSITLSCLNESTMYLNMFVPKSCKKLEFVSKDTPMMFEKLEFWNEVVFENINRNTDFWKIYFHGKSSDFFEKYERRFLGNYNNKIRFLFADDGVFFLNR